LSNVRVIKDLYCSLHKLDKQPLFVKWKQRRVIYTCVLAAASERRGQGSVPR